MRKLALALTFLPVVACAQPTPSPSPPSDRAWRVMAENAVLREQALTAAVIDLQDRLAETKAKLDAAAKPSDKPDDAATH